MSMELSEPIRSIRGIKNEISHLTYSMEDGTIRKIKGVADDGSPDYV